MGILIALAAFSSGYARQTPVQTDSCVQCHAESAETRLSAPVSESKGDVHMARRFSCSSCHGGDSTQMDPKRAMDPRKAFVGKPAPAAVASVCGKCHSDAALIKKYNPALRVDQVSEYATSVHGKMAAKGDAKVATCASCHGAHGIRKVSDPKAPVYPASVASTCGRCHSDQADQYHGSVHADAMIRKQDLTAPTCNDCHGNHGAAPPGVESVANVCGACHSRQADLFRQSPHQSAFDALGIGQCLACHENHKVTPPTDEMLGAGPKTVCVQCHSEGEPGFDAAKKMRADIDNLALHFRQADVLLNRARQAGMEVSRPRFELAAAQDKMIDARVIVHQFSSEEIGKATGAGLDIADKAMRSGEQALDELEFRRKGLAASLVIILLAIVSIYLKLRQIEGNKSKEEV